jgi:HD superfamily phosphohydrolase
MFVKDPIFGNISLTNTEAKIIDDKHMQRLHYIRQTSFVYLVYPGATHSRFEHSLGTMYITNEITRSVGIEGDRAEELCIAGLVHDIGHAPFSHTLDELLEKYLHTSHEEIGRRIIEKSEIKDIINESGLSVSRILKMLKGKGKGDIVTASLGSDRLDYLLRDAHYTGTSYGTIDYQQLKSKMSLYKGRLAIYAQGIPSAESILLARYFMFTSVYFHHAALIADGMFERAVELAIVDGHFDAKLLKKFNDFDMVNALLSNKSSEPLLNKILERRLFKRAFYNNIPSIVSLNKEEIEEEILKHTDLNRTEFIVKKISPKNSVEDTPILNRQGKKVDILENASPIIRGLKEANSHSTKLLVACEKRNIEKVNIVVNKILDLKHLQN